MTMTEDLILRLAIGAVVLLSGLAATFVAYALWLHLRADREVQRRADLEARWRHHLLDAAMGEGPDAAGDGTGTHAADTHPTVAHPTVEAGERILFLEMVTDYARALHGPERRRLEQIGVPYLDALDRLLDDADPYKRAHGLDILGELAPDAGRPRIVRALEDESGFVAMVAARALARHGDPSHVPLLLGRLESFENWSTGYLASLFTSFGPDAAPALRELALDRTAQGRFRCVALRALRTLNDVPSVEGSTPLLASEPDPEVQADLIRLLGTLGRPEHLEAVRPFVDSPEPHVRAAAVRALAALSDRHAPDVTIVTQALDDPSPWVALQAARGLLELGCADELAALAASPSPRANLAAEVLEARR